MIIYDKFIIKEHSSQLSSSQIQELISSKLHQCALVWSDRCAYCEIGFDGLKQKLSSSAEPTEEHLNELIKKIEECLTKLEGLFASIDNNC
jgi:hypothetical protein